MKTFFLVLKITLVLKFAVIPFAQADWPMPGQNPQRTSFVAETILPCHTPLWHVRFDGLIPSRSHIITTSGSGSILPTILVTTADGIHALSPDDGSERWWYAMELPPGDSPTVVDSVVYVAGTDKTVHALALSNGEKIWQTDSAGAPFYVNPLVVDQRIYLGSRDGFFYCFDAANGQLIWYKEIGERISFSAAFQTYPEYPTGLVFFAAENNCAYALLAEDGNKVWESCQLPGDTFTGFWPVIGQDRVLLATSTNYPTSDVYDLNGRAREELIPDEDTLRGLVEEDGRLNVQHHIDWLTQYPQRRTLLVLDRSNGQQKEIAPILWWGNPGGQRYPPALDANGRVWINSTWNGGWFCSGRYAGWEIGTNKIWTVPGLFSGLEAGDEPEAHALIGNFIYYTAGGDGADKAGAFQIDGGGSVFAGSSTFYAVFGDYWEKFVDRKYGNVIQVQDPNNMWVNSLGWHGHQNPPVPLNGKVYFHRSNAVICMKP